MRRAKGEAAARRALSRGDKPLELLSPERGQQRRACCAPARASHAPAGPGPCDFALVAPRWHAGETPRAAFLSDRPRCLVPASSRQLKRARIESQDPPRACRRDSSLPLCGSFGSEDPQRGSEDEVALKVESVVNRSVHAEEALGRSVSVIKARCRQSRLRILRNRARRLGAGRGWRQSSRGRPCTART